ncbi:MULTISPECIES: hypothetical protein [Burkholderia]|uniref:hypothetical protein n=1 Tax=Burkholderia TaxID=32008 RepID=UPI0012BBF49C|nr:MULTISPECIES: hypothetical protein [Burkholderia]
MLAPSRKERRAESPSPKGYVDISGGRVPAIKIAPLNASFRATCAGDRAVRCPSAEVLISIIEIDRCVHFSRNSERISQ